MRLITALFIMAVFPLMVQGQELILLTALHDSLRETSGLIYLNQKLITHNDSGGKPEFYTVQNLPVVCR